MNKASASSDLPHPDEGDLRLDSVLFALSDPTRLDIVAQLVSGPQLMAQCHLQNPNVPKSTKSHCMKVLREAGIIRNLPQGRGRVLSLRREELDRRFPGLLDAVLTAHEASASTD